MRLQELAYELAAACGYGYAQSDKYIMLCYSDRLKLNMMIRFILEQER